MSSSSSYFNSGGNNNNQHQQQQRAVNRNCSVFVGNIPYEASEEELREIFSRVGPVISFRLMKDKETGMPKGYGFCEYRDMETAYSAMRNLSNADYGGRPLRVDWADHELRNSEAVTKVLRTSNAEVSERTEKIVKDRLQEFRGKITDETIELAVSDMQPFREIATLIDLLTPEQLVHILAEMQRLILTDPDTSKALLSTQPQLRLAIAFALVRINVITNPLHNNNKLNKSIIGVQDNNKRQRIMGESIPPPPWASMIGQHHHHHEDEGDEDDDEDDEDEDDRIINNNLYDVTQLTSDEKMKVIEQFSSLSTDEISELPSEVRESMETLVREWVVKSQEGEEG